VIECAKAHGYTVREECIKKDDLWAHDGAFLTNTSHSLVPIRSVDARSFPVIPESTGELRKALRAFLEQTVLV